MQDILSLSAVDLMRLMRQKKLGVEELVQFYLTRMEQYGLQNDLNAIREINENALSDAKELDSRQATDDLPLYGLPILVKDNIDVLGCHTTAGSAALADNLALSDAPVIANLRRRGAVILGKTNMTEFANFTSHGMPNGFSSLGGQVKNTYDPNADPNGSSTGSAVAVSAGLCAAALGTDTSYSIIGCAMIYGLAGYKPPHGALPSQGIIPISRTLDSVGPMAKTLADAIAVYNGMKGHALHIMPKDPKNIRLAVNIYQKEDVSQEQMGKYEDLLSCLEKDGGAIDEVCHPWTPGMGDIMAREYTRDLEDYLHHSQARRKTLAEIIAFYETHPENMPYGITTLRSSQSIVLANDYEEKYCAVMAERKSLRAEALESLKNYDACLLTGTTEVMHMAGLPTVALRLGMGSDGAPRGVVRYGADEAQLLSAALTLEKYCQPIDPPERYV